MSANSEKTRLLSMAIDRMRLDEAAAALLEVCRTDSRDGCATVVTPNVDHAVMLSRRADLRAAYDSARFVFADGWPIVLASRLLGQGLPERVAGSDLVPAVFELASRQVEGVLRVYLLGAAPGVAERAARQIGDRFKRVEVVGTYSPPHGFERNRDECDAILERIAAADADFLVVGLGAPKQELWVHAHRERLEVKVAVCGGATIDFLAGEKRRSPRWMQRVGLEWFHRLVSEPRRLMRRYAVDAWTFPKLVWREWRRGGIAG